MSGSGGNTNKASLTQWAGRAFAPRNVIGFCLYLLFCAAVLHVIVSGASSSGYFWQWYRVERIFFTGLNAEGVRTFWAGPMIRGLGMTLRIGAVSLCAALLIALAVTAMRLGGGPVARALSVAYVQLIRNTPLLVQILFVYFVVAPGFGLAAEPSAVIALSLFEGAYMSEIFRAGILTVPRGQWEAAVSLGLPGSYAARDVILPQAVRNALPPLLSECVTLVKNTSLASVISVTELTFMGKKTISDTFMSLEIWLTVALVYLCLSLAMSAVAWLLRRWLNRGWTRGRCAA